MPCNIIEQVKIGGLQNFDAYDKLNPVEATVRDSELNTFLLFSSTLTNDTTVISVSCNGLPYSY